MVLTASKMIPLGTKAPNFSLPDVVSGKESSLNQLKSEIATVVMFICNHCPFVQHIQKKLSETAKRYHTKGIHFVAINSNDAESYPEDSLENMKITAEKFDYSFPYLFDETQEIARAYQAACTPDFYIFDSNLLCVYRGRFDSSSPGKKTPVTGQDLKRALDNLLSGNPVDREQQPSRGCSIKWKS
ncbi:thioredoxin family protein [Coxiella endosymbiont of Amblyomma sculptum]|uniref:thioredoxin family protein n=1 Tax=Coxiella endosymbiont of Amblyomma sculptum TaxID=2487929 RepID=UPI00132F075B|nr:thioredoxin family protein [Coxiella endosymbiont of Amblyomma sculptum]QHG92514.1 thioredoxin family protein [Coxiella endosymbiont of Amblyomma sculptum]